MSTTAMPAPVVTELNTEAATWPSPNRMIHLSDLLALCAELEVVVKDLDLSSITTRLSDLADAVTRASAVNNQRHIHDLWTLTPEEMEQRVIAAATDLAIHKSGANVVATDFETALMREASAAMTEKADAVVAALRPDYDSQVKVVQAAAAAGLDGSTSMAAVVETDSAKTVAEKVTAFRALGPAVSRLNQIGSLRSRLLEVLRYGPDASEPAAAVAAFVTDVPGAARMQEAIVLWHGQTETVQLNVYNVHTGSSLVKQQTKRLGGPWLSLVSKGFALRLNDAVETEAVIRTARAAH